MRQLLPLALFAGVIVATGCRSGSSSLPSPASRVATAEVAVSQVAYSETPDDETPDERRAEDTGPQATSEPTLLPSPSPLPPPPSEAGAQDQAETQEQAEPQAQEVVPAPPRAPTLAELIDSVRLHFPVIQEAIAARTIASGETLAAWGAFDHKLEGLSESQPLGYYETYRQSLGVKRDTLWGGQTFAGYRVGRGFFEPWYLERQTNDGGEFKTGFIAPLAKDRAIDANRAEVWRAQLERGRVEPEIRAMVIGSARDATIAYWQWVGSAANYRISESFLQLGVNRVDFLRRQIEAGEKANIDLVDNQRIILSRQAKLVDDRRKLEQSAFKLSLFLRDSVGDPLIVPIELATLTFPTADELNDWDDEAAIARALANRPELEELRLVRRQLDVALQQARNESIPDLDAGLLVSQDVGEPTSSKRDKSELELEASVMLSVPLERRKALGKARQLRGKLAQVSAKTRFAADKIAAESRSAHAALVAAAQRVTQTAEGVKLAEQMRVAEQRRYELGDSTLFNLNLREQQAAEAALDAIAALFDYHVARADYAAALGLVSSEEL
jgi:outer membrane protein TolC